MWRIRRVVRRLLHQRTRTLVLRNALQDEANTSYPDIKVYLDTAAGTSSDGICIGLNPFDYRVVVENVQGRLIVHVWDSYEAAVHGCDPSHSIEIELRSAEGEESACQECEAEKRSALEYRIP